MGFFSFRIFFSDNTRVRIFIFVVDLTLGNYMTKTLNQIIFFQQHWESEYIFRKKKITPHPPGS